jgi:hypothetical protein
MRAMVQGTEQVAEIAARSSTNAETTAAAATEQVTASMERFPAPTTSLATLAGDLGNGYKIQNLNSVVFI